MSHSNISIFIPHLGCPHMCSFCNQNSITGSKEKAPHIEEIVQICQQAFDRIKDKSQTEIAFFGGSFTAIDRNYMLSLLQCVQKFIGDGKFKGIRLSTRPDYIDNEILDILKKYNVTTIELGVQSMDNIVLNANERGHTSQDVEKAVNLIKEYDFNLGLQLMVGLYKSTPELDLYTAEKIIDMKPKEVRIYPVVIMEHTKLGELFKSGEYVPYSLDTAVDICCRMIKMFEKENITIIKLGLHASEIVEQNLLGGLYHPAFRELCDNKIFCANIYSEIKNCNYEKGKYIVYVSSKSVSKAIGQAKCNVLKLHVDGYDIKVKQDESLNGYNIRIVKEECSCI